MSFSTTSIAPPSLRSSNRLRRGLPLHPACGNAQAISGVFSVASHSALQHLPDVVTHEQSGWAQFTAFSEAISFPPTSAQERMTQVQMLVSRKECFRTKRNTLRIVVRTVAAIDWQSVGLRYLAGASLRDDCGGILPLSGGVTAR